MRKKAIKWIAFCLFVFVTLLLSLRTLQQLFHVADLSNLGVMRFFITVLSGLVFLRFSEKDKGVVTSTFQSINPNRGVFFLVYVIAGAIFLAIVVTQLNVAMDFDEQVHATHVAEGKIEPLNPLNSSSYHSLSYALAYVSTRITGYSHEKVRLAAVALFAVLLIVFSHFSATYLSLSQSVLFLGHIFMNGLFFWYAHSLRGYIAMTTVVFLVFMIFYRAQATLEPPSRKSQWMLIALFAIAPFTHALCVFTISAMVLAGLLWCFLNQDIKARDLRRWALGRAPFAVSLFFLYLVFLIRVVFFTHAKAEVINLTYTPNYLAELSLAFGGARTWLLLTLSSFVLFLLGRIPFKKLGSDFLLLSITIIAFAQVVTQVALKGIFFGRFVLPIVPLAVLWIVREVRNTEKQYAFLVRYGVALAILIVVPGVHQKEIQISFSSATEQFHRFATRVEDYDDSTGNKNCFAADGEWRQVEWMVGRMKDRMKERNQCKVRSVAYFPAVVPGSTVASPPFGSVVIEDEAGRKLINLSNGQEVANRK